MKKQHKSKILEIASIQDTKDSELKDTGSKFDDLVISQG
jgi:hypothetical protein